MNISLQGGCIGVLSGFTDTQGGLHDPLLIDYFLPCLFNGTHALHLLSLAVLYPMINFLIFCITINTPEQLQAFPLVEAYIRYCRIFFLIFFLYTLDFLPLLFSPSGHFYWAGTRRMAGWVVVHFFF